MSGGLLWYVCLIKSVEMLSVFIWLSTTFVVMYGKYLLPTNEFITIFCSLLMGHGIVSYCSMIVYLQLTEIHKSTIIKLSNRTFKFDFRHSNCHT